MEEDANITFSDWLYEQEKDDPTELPEKPFTEFWLQATKNESVTCLFMSDFLEDALAQYEVDGYFILENAQIVEKYLLTLHSLTS